MNVAEFLGSTYEVLGVVGTLMGVFGVPGLAVFYNRALKREIAFSPALAYAYSYFENYITPLHGRLVSGEPLTDEGAQIDRIFIRMPKTLADVSADRLNAIRRHLEKRGESIEEVAVQTPSGKRTVAILHRDSHWIAYDVPRILSALEPIISEHIGAPRTRGENRWEKIERREIAQFCSHVRRLIRAHHFEDHIKVFDCEVADLTPDTDDLDPTPLRGFLDRLFGRFRRS